MKISEIEELSKNILSENRSDSVTVYLLDPTTEIPKPEQINRTAGNPIGISDQDWPKYENLKMEHAITLDLDSVPVFKNELGTDARAISIFVSSLIHNQAFEPNNKEIGIVFLSQKDIERGEVEFDPKKIREKEQIKQVQYLEMAARKFSFRYRIMSILGLALNKNEFDSVIEVENTDELVDRSTFTCHEVVVPSDVFDIDSMEEGSRLEELSDGIQQYGIVGGKPFWLQSAEYHKSIILQFHEGLVDMNLGDAGVMYVFEDTAFWQCH